MLFQAIDLLDEAGSRARISAFNMRKQRQTSVLSATPADIWAEIRAVEKQQQSSLVLANEPSSPSFNLFEEAPSKAAIAAAPVSELDAAVKRAGFSTFWEDEDDVVVGLEDIAAVASIWSGVPVQQLTTEESARLVDLENTLRTRVIGQVGLRTFLIGACRPVALREGGLAKTGTSEGACAVLGGQINLLLGPGSLL